MAEDDSAAPQPAPSAKPAGPEVPDFTGTAHFESQNTARLVLRGTPLAKSPVVKESGGES